jgi:hypothetical protein
MSKLDELRVHSKETKHFTPEMDKLLLKARTGKKVVPYSQIKIFWERLGWGHISHATLVERVNKLKAAR